MNSNNNLQKSCDPLHHEYCHTCGESDSDQALFDCPFCGTAFDLVDFHRKEIARMTATIKPATEPAVVSADHSISGKVMDARQAKGM